MELLHRQLSRYAAFAVDGEAEALELLSQISADMYETPPRLVEFNDDGFLVSIQPPDEGDFAGDAGEYEDETVHLARFANERHLLTIELFDDMADMADPLHLDNIMLAKHLERLCEQRATRD